MMMKKLLFVLVLTALAVSLADAQVYVATGAPRGEIVKAWNFKTHTNFVDASDDTTGYITLAKWGGLVGAREVYIGIVANDSVNASCRLLVYNTEVSSTAISMTNTKEIELIGNTGGVAWWTLKSPTVDLLAGGNKFKLATVFDSDSLGVTTGRTLKFYLTAVK